MLVVGLTGGIGSGKTTVSDRLAQLGAGIVDTDLLSRELTEPGSAALDQIAGALGTGLILPDGSLDRAALRQLVFRSQQARARLESILHPAIRDLMLERVAELETPYAVAVVPLLFETGQESLVDRTLVVDVPREVQIERVTRRSGLNQAEVERILASQASREERLARADDVLDNSGDVQALLAQTDALHRQYIALAEQTQAP